MSYAQERSSGAGGVLVGIVGLGVLIVMVLGGTAATTLESVSAPIADVSSHAVERHGADAQIALDMVKDNGHCDNCTDGRMRCLANNGNRWAVVVYQMAKDSTGASVWTVITSFLCDQDYAMSVRENCQPGWRERLHP